MGHEFAGFDLKFDAIKPTRYRAYPLGVTDGDDGFGYLPGQEIEVVKRAVGAED